MSTGTTLMDLAAWLDWPVDFADDAVWCAAQGCPVPGCGPGNDEQRICGQEGLTPRMLLEAVKAHTEGRRGEH